MRAITPGGASKRLLAPLRGFGASRIANDAGRVYSDRMAEASLSDLAAAVQSLHRGIARHVQTVQVDRQPGAPSEWDGMVYVFAIDHPKTSRAYAWSHIVGKKAPRRCFRAILGVLPIRSATDAVRTAIANGD